MDIPAANWNEADSSNSVAAPDGAPEGMAPSGVNDVLRAHQGALKRWYNWTVPKLTAGTSTAYTLGYGVAPAALVDGMTHMIQFHTANGAAPTLNVNSLGALPIQYYSAGAWRALPPTLFGQDWICELTYNVAIGAYRMIGFDNRTGTIEDYGGAGAPEGAILAFGQAVSRTQYAGLFARFGMTYGSGDGSTTFNVPDLRGKVSAGKSDMGGSDVGNLAGGATLGAALGNQIGTGNVFGSTAGSLSVATNSTSMDGPNSIGSASGGGGGAFNYADISHGHANVRSVGATSGSLIVSGSTSMAIVQPTLVTNKVVRT
jgi:microcystin-dependent protein